ncbi:MAG: HAMP domain-containing protein [Polyangiaceae bacterium]|nr:HAMP domain-containing protein [Polyangiaceae bacterium]MCW5789746.1 HAMP domain-containing protein [Polyangiaceae bacterium]
MVPVVGLEFARAYERQLLQALERDMNDQAALTVSLLEHDLAEGIALGAPRHGKVLSQAAERTRTRIRVLDPSGEVLSDSHEGGPPEGPEPAPPSLLGRSVTSDVATRRASTWPAVPDRVEVRRALAGEHSAHTRTAHRPSAVFLFIATPVRASDGQVRGAVYVTRSTLPVLEELHRVRRSLLKVVLVTLAISVSVTLLLAFSISSPLGRLARAAARITRGERQVPVPVAGTGEIRELAQSFKAMTEELDQRLRYISDFAADVAHEFKSPLTSIRGAAELLAEGASEIPEDRERFLQNILLDAERLDRLVTRLLVLSRIEAREGHLTLVDVALLLERVSQRASHAPGAEPVELALTATRRWVPGHEADLEIAVSNLIDNAQRYSPAGEAPRVLLQDDRGGLRITVRDAGPGIPEARRAKVFDRFYTTDGERGGTGLGLAIVSSVARAHGGAVWLECEAEGGTAVHLWLPGARSAAPRAST